MDQFRENRSHSTVGSHCTYTKMDKELSDLTITMPTCALQAEKLSSLKFMDMLGEKRDSGSKKVDPLKSWAYKERMQEERQRAIDMYRDMKSKKRLGTLT